MVAFPNAIVLEKYAEPPSHNFRQVVFVVQGGKRPGDSTENQETIFILKPVTTGLLSKVASNKSYFLKITSGSMRNSLCKVVSKNIHSFFPSLFKQF